VAAQKFANNASSLLAASIDDIETSIQLDSGYGALFPSPGAGEYFVVALENSAGDLEVCKVTARATDLLTVVRGWEDTVPQSWTNGVTRVELRNTAGSMRQMIQRSGDTMEGDLYMDGNSIHDAVLEGATVIMPGAIIMGATITNSAGDLTNAITIPEDGQTPPLVGGSPILTQASFDPQSVFTAGMIMSFYGDVNDIPNGWALCDGNNGRPDLRNRFIVGVGSDYVLGNIGGDDQLTGLSVASGGGGSTGSHALTEAEMPAHSHRLWVWLGNTSNDQVDSIGGRDAHIAGEVNPTGGYAATNGDSDQLVEDTGSGDAHSHSVAAHTHDIPTLDNRPPYYALYFIIKVDPDGDYGGVGGGTPGGGSMYDMYNEDGCTSYIGGQATLMDDVAIVSGQAQINCCASNVFRIVLTGNTTLLAPNNPISGQVINVIVKQGGSGSYTMTWPANFKFPSGTDPTLSTAVGSKDILTCQYDSADNEWLVTSVLNFS
jgi:microcystin-dependent protein